MTFPLKYFWPTDWTSTQEFTGGICPGFMITEGKRFTVGCLGIKQDDGLESLDFTSDRGLGAPRSILFIIDSKAAATASPESESL